MQRHTLDAHARLHILPPLLRDCQIEAVPFSEVHVVGHLLFSAVAMLIRCGQLAPWRQTICPIDLESDYYALIGTNKWFSIHPCMHWCGADGLRRWMVERKQKTCPVCRSAIKFALPAVRPSAL
tara:strand:- start:146 stop:517 length:372 start_codon:yes stop_codon:yes gene_type:complete